MDSIFNSIHIGAKFHHIGIACEKIEDTHKAIQFLLPQNYLCSKVVYDPNLKANLQLISSTDNTFFELVSGEMVKSFIKRNITLYHLCFEVNSIKEARQSIPKRDLIAITNPTPALLFNNRFVQFFNTPFGLVELLETR